VAGYGRFVVTLANGEGIPATTLIWTEGVKPVRQSLLYHVADNVVAWP